MTSFRDRWLATNPVPSEARRIHNCIVLVAESLPYLFEAYAVYPQANLGRAVKQCARALIVLQRRESRSKRESK